MKISYHKHNCSKTSVCCRQFLFANWNVGFVFIETSDFLSGLPLANENIRKDTEVSNLCMDLRPYKGNFGLYYRV